jgi:hypothetical protein
VILTQKQVQRIIREELIRLEEQGCADRQDGCVRKDKDGTWYILNNKKGGIWKRGFKSEQSAKDSLSAMHARGR